MLFKNLIKYYFAFKTRLKISDQKLLNFAEKGKFFYQSILLTECKPVTGKSLQTSPVVA